jgi:hypothetical protein
MSNSMKEVPKGVTQFSVGVLANLHDSAPVKVDPLTVQQIPAADKQLEISKLGTIAESIALKMTFLIVKPAPTRNLNLSAIL